MIFPENLRYTKEHTWLKIDGNDGIIGITEFAQSELGEILYVDLPNVGAKFKQNVVFGSVEAIKTVSDLFMPISGKVVEINKTLLKEPTLVNSSPYEEGWMMKIDIETIDESGNLMEALIYQKLTGLVE